jgi:hypothetical protein
VTTGKVNPYYELAVAGYHAYGEHVAWRNYAGLPMPPWAALPTKIQEAWVEAARAIVAASEPDGKVGHG